MVQWHSLSWPIVIFLQQPLGLVLMKANKTKTVKKYSHIETRTNNPTLLQYGAPCYGVRLFYSQRKMSVIKTKIKLLFPKTLLPWHVLCKVPKSITYSLAHRSILNWELTYELVNMYYAKCQKVLHIH